MAMHARSEVAGALGRHNKRNVTETRQRLRYVHDDHVRKVRILKSRQTKNGTSFQNKKKTRMWANAQPDGRPAEHRWRPLFNAAKFS